MLPQHPLPADDVDRKALRRVAERFRADHRMRLDRLRSALGPEQRVIVDALPLLLHANHPALPGFVDHEAPCGIDRYTPDPVTLAAVRNMALSFTVERFVERSRHLQGLFLLPADEVCSDHTLWVCCTEAHHRALRVKLDGVEAFARRQGLPLRLTAIDPLAVRSGAHVLGDTPALDLDRFYLRGLWIAGRHPLWWLVPAAAEANYQAHCERLLRQRFVARDEALDLGPLHIVPADEWVHLAFGLLERAADEPYAVLPSILLIEARTARRSGEGPRGLLALAYKAALHDAARDEGVLEPQRLAYDEIGHYLAADSRRTWLLRRACLRADPHAFEPLLDAWLSAPGGAAELATSWPLGRLASESALIGAELAHALEVVDALIECAPRARLEHAAARERLERARRRIGRFAAAHGEHVPRINPALLPDRITQPIEVRWTGAAWCIEDGGVALYASARLVPVALWLHVHRVGAEQTITADAVCRARIVRLLAVLRAHLPRPPDTAHECRPRTLLLLNVEHEPLDDEHLAHEEARLTDWDDPLEYSGHHHLLVAGVDRVHIGERLASAGENGRHAFPRALAHVLNAPHDEVVCICAGTLRPHAIRERVTDLVADLRAAFHVDTANGRYVFPCGTGFGVVVREGTGDRVTVDLVADEASLAAFLRSPLATGRPITVADPRSRRLVWLRRLSEIVEVGRPVLLVTKEPAAAGTTASTLTLAHHDGAIHRFTAPVRTMEAFAADLHEFFRNLRLHGAQVPRIYAASEHALNELRVPPVQDSRALALRLRRERGRFDVAAGAKRWANVPITPALLDEVLNALPGDVAASNAAPRVSSIAFDGDTPDLPEVLALKLAFERRLEERL